MIYVIAAVIAALVCGSISALIGYTLGTEAQWIAMPGLFGLSMLVGIFVARD